MHINLTTVLILNHDRHSLLTHRLQTHVVDDGSSETLRHTSCDSDLVDAATEIVEVAHADVDNIVGVVLVDSKDEALAARL